MYFVDSCHSAGIKVIMDWVPAHFPKDAHGLRRFDGTFLYEYEDPLLGEHPHWGTLVFDYSKPEVRSFLVSSAMFWLDIYRIDGLRVDAVSSMIYRDYGREQGEWLPNREGGNINLEAVEFLQYLNKTVFAEFPNALMIAEEATAFPKVTMPVHEGGLGFNYKWNMGWMNDTLKYFSMDPVYRKDSHHLLTFLIMYTYSENFILPLSHDEVVHGKKTIVDQMWGNYDQKFAQVRNLYVYMFAHPGKKLNFMGNELAMFREFDEDRELDWMLLEYGRHNAFARFFRDLGQIYISHPALYKYDYEHKGFRWIDADNADQSIYSFYREDENEYIICVMNLTGNTYEEFLIGVPQRGSYKELINSEWSIYDGCDFCNYKPVRSKKQKKPVHGYENAINIRIAPFGAMLLSCKNKAKKENYNKKKATTKRQQQKSC